MAKKFKIQATSVERTYLHLYTASRDALTHARSMEENRSEGYLYFYMMAGTFAAFTVEAYLNHLGVTHVKHWSRIERKLSPDEKLELISDEIGFSLQRDERPFQTWRNMRTLRDELAHGKTEVATRTVESNVRKDVAAEPNWKRLATREQTSRMVDDAKAMITALCEAVGDDPSMTFRLLSTFSSIATPQESLED